MTKKSHRKRKQQPARQFPWLWLAVGGALLLIGGGLMMVWTSSPDPGPVVAPEVTGAPGPVVAPKVTGAPDPVVAPEVTGAPDPVVAPEVTGAPRLAVDQTLIDEGYVKFNTPVQTTFRLRNVGDQPLQILGQPQVELVEGC